MLFVSWAPMTALPETVDAANVTVAALAPALAHKDRAGRAVEGADLFGPTLAVAGAGVSNAGRPRLPIRLMVSLLYLKHAYGESDKSVVERSRVRHFAA